MKLDELPDGSALIARTVGANGDISWATQSRSTWHHLASSLSELCELGVEAAHRRVAAAMTGVRLPAEKLTVLAPIDDVQEVWAAGVTYERSKIARIEESGERDLYSAVYESARPELFFKSIGTRVVGTDEPIAVRADARWNVPEPELVVVFDADGEVLGYTIGNDVSSRDIEGANALYLPQAKVYDRSCALGPAIVPAWALNVDPSFEIELEIRRGSDVVFEGGASTSQLHRHWRDLGSWLRSCLTFRYGVILMTGTGIVPSNEVTLMAGDEVTIRITQLGELRNAVQITGVAEPA